MVEFLSRHQTDIMQFFSGICGVSAALLFVTKALSKKRRNILILMELTAMFLLIFDRLAYVYAGDMSRTGYIMVRLSNFIVFFLTSEVVLAFNLYLIDLLTDEGELEEVPRRLVLVNILASLGMFLAVLNHFSGIYYIIDENNQYHRTPGFIICYILPVVGPLIQFTAVRKYRTRFTKIIRTSLYLFLILPITASLIQIFAYGLSLTNLTIVLVSVCMYVFAYHDVNDKIEKAHLSETAHLKRDTKALRHLFEETVTAFTSALDDRDAYSKGRSGRVASYAKRLAEEGGLSKKDCEDVYIKALVHDIGKIGIPEEVLVHEDDPNEEELKILKRKPLIGSKILSYISEYPGLDAGAKYCNERYDGSGYPQGLKGEDIPQAARIIAVAREYDNMTSRTSYRDPLPQQIVREQFVTGAGRSMDPVYAKIMMRMIDADGGYSMREEGTMKNEEATKELHCKVYREDVTEGILVDSTVTRISFKCEEEKENESDFSGPSIILFDSFDAHVHNNSKTIGAYAYKEYGELWFDGHHISTIARNMKVTMDEEAGRDHDKALYEIESVRFHDHLRVRLISHYGVSEAIVALSNEVSWAYIGITGENCHIYDITTVKTEETAGQEEIERIADEVSYIDRIESDLPNIQINATRAVTTAGISINDGRRIFFHTMSLPMANLVWHCPYIVIFYSDDGQVNGPGYKEYALVKLNGEDNGSNEYAQNSFVMKKKDEFKGWESWKDRNKEGLEVEIDFVRRGRRITFSTSNLGIEITNTTTVDDGPDTVYVAITGDQVALTDIRVN